MTNKTWVLAGLSGVCKTLRDGFNSRPRLQLYWANKPWPVNFVDRNKLIDNLFFTRKWYTHYRKEIKSHAFNKAYLPPINPVNLSRAALGYERNRADRYKAEMIKSRKELSKLKRTNNGARGKK